MRKIKAKISLLHLSSITENAGSTELETLSHRTNQPRAERKVDFSKAYFGSEKMKAGKMTGEARDGGTLRKTATTKFNLMLIKSSPHDWAAH